jgi:hypothetical protein
MSKLGQLFLITAVLCVLAVPGMVHACPTCKEAPGAKNSDEEGSGNAAAYNQSIYLMVSVPYITLGIGTVLVYRGIKKNEAYQRARGWSEDQTTEPPNQAATL